MTDDFLRQRPQPRTQLVLIGIAAMFLLAAVLVVWFSGIRSQIVQLSDSVVEDEFVADPVVEEMSGNLYFVGMTDASIEPTAVPQVFHRDMTTGDTVVHDLGPTTSYAFGTAGIDMAISYYENTTDPDGYQPSLIDVAAGTARAAFGQDAYFETDIAISPGDQYYSFSFRTSDLGDGDRYDDLADWNIAIHDLDTGDEIVILPAAAEAHWLSEQDVLYMRPDGLHIYDLQTRTTFPLYDHFTDLRMTDDIAVSADGQTIILTIGGEGLIIVLAVEVSTDRATFRVTPRLVIDEPGTPWRHPVIDPTGTWYAAYYGVYEDRNDGKQPPVSAEPRIEIRNIDSEEVIATFTYPDLDPRTVRLEAWHR